MGFEHPFQEYQPEEPKSQRDVIKECQKQQAELQGNIFKQKVHEVRNAQQSIEKRFSNISFVHTLASSAKNFSDLEKAMYNPSRACEVAPHMQSWFVQTAEGVVKTLGELEKKLDSYGSLFAKEDRAIRFDMLWAREYVGNYLEDAPMQATTLLLFPGGLGKVFESNINTFAYEQAEKQSEMAEQLQSPENSKRHHVVKALIEEARASGTNVPKNMEFYEIGAQQMQNVLQDVKGIQIRIGGNVFRGSDYVGEHKGKFYIQGLSSSAHIGALKSLAQERALLWGELQDPDRRETLLQLCEVDSVLHKKVSDVLRVMETEEVLPSEDLRERVIIDTSRLGSINPPKTLPLPEISGTHKNLPAQKLTTRKDADVSSTWESWKNSKSRETDTSQPFFSSETRAGFEAEARTQERTQEYKDIFFRRDEEPKDADIDKLKKIAEKATTIEERHETQISLEYLPSQGMTLENLEEIVEEGDIAFDISSSGIDQVLQDLETINVELARYESKNVFHDLNIRLFWSGREFGTTAGTAMGDTVRFAPRVSKSTIHHELFHYFDNNDKGAFEYFWEQKAEGEMSWNEQLFHTRSLLHWSAYSMEGEEYTDGKSNFELENKALYQKAHSLQKTVTRRGKSYRIDGSDLFTEDGLPINGTTAYSLKMPLEERAELWADIMTNPQKIEDQTNNNPVLQAKVNVLKAVLKNMGIRPLAQ